MHLAAITDIIKCDLNFYVWNAIRVMIHPRSTCDVVKFSRTLDSGANSSTANCRCSSELLLSYCTVPYLFHSPPSVNFASLTVPD